MTHLAPGVWGVLPTPFHDSNLAVDHASIVRAVDLYRTLGATGVVGLGVFGEAARLERDERLGVLRTVVDAARGELGIVAGITYSDTAAAAAEAEALTAVAGDRLTAVMVQVNSPEPGELERHFATVHEACGLGVVAQDYPVATGVVVEPAALAKAVAGRPWLAAVKCESPPTSPAIARLAELVDAPLFGGLGGIGLLDELMAGAAGAMTGFSHPEVLLATVEAYRTGGHRAARRAIEPWLPLINFEAQVKVGLAIRKENLRRRGVLSSGAVRPPALPLPSGLASLVEAHWTSRPEEAA